MEVSFDKEIKRRELNVRLQGQQMAKDQNEITILRFKRDIERLEQTNMSLQKEIEITGKMMTDLERGGEN